MVRTKLL